MWDFVPSLCFFIIFILYFFQKQQIKNKNMKKSEFIYITTSENKIADVLNNLKSNFKIGFKIIDMHYKENGKINILAIGTKRTPKKNTTKK